MHRASKRDRTNIPDSSAHVINGPFHQALCFALQLEARVLMSLPASKCGNDAEMLSGLRCFSPKTVSMMFKGQIAIAIDLHQFFGETAPSRRTTCDACRSGRRFLPPQNRAFRQLLEGLELIGGMHIFPRDVLV